MVQSGIFPEGRAPNHVLINEYQNGAGISPHSDGPLYFPQVAVLTLAGGALLDFYAASLPSSVVASIYLRPRSLHVVSNDVYENFLHGIAAGCEDAIQEGCLNLPWLPDMPLGAIARSPLRYSIVFVHKIGARFVTTEESPR